MKKIFLFSLMFVVMSCSLVFAEASFEQIQGLIKEQNYSAAIQGLEGIIQNHPKSAKAFYAMSQAQAGIGNQLKAKEALDRATGLDPNLKFASSSNVEKLKEAITPQTKKIEAIESHTLRNCSIVLILLSICCIFIFRKKKYIPLEPTAEAAAPPFYPHSQAPPSMREESTCDTHNNTFAQSEARHSTLRSYQREAIRPVQTTVINNMGNGGLMEGMLIGSMLNQHHERTVVEREVIVEREVPVRESTREISSKSWDEPRETKTESSWDDKSSSGSYDKSWDSGSSSSDSSWDSGSSDSSSSDSSSSWD